MEDEVSGFWNFNLEVCGRQNIHDGLGQMDQRHSIVKFGVVPRLGVPILGGELGG